MNQRVFAFGLMRAMAGALAACSGNQGSNSAASPSPGAQSVAATGSPATVAAFTDINGYDGAQQINDLAALGVFDQTSGAFKPNDPITRRDFVRWLVKANNAIVKDPSYHVRLAQGNTATFVDVPAGDPDFKYIQGLADSGYVIGVDKSHFAPNKKLTREQMIYVKASLDEHHTITTSPDKGQRPTSYTDMSKALFKPQDPVTRGDAALALSVMKGEWPISAAATLGRTPYP